MKILAFDTATEACTAALQCGDEVIERFEHSPQQQANLILPMIDELMSEAAYSMQQLDAISFGRGPGSFTGLRVAAGVAQGLAFASDLPLIPISTLAIMAQTAYRIHGKSSLLATIDARMNEVYWAEYCVEPDAGQTSVVKRLAEERVSPVSDICWQGTGLLGVGSGFRAHLLALQEHMAGALAGYDEQLWPDAQDQLVLACRAYRLGELVGPEQAIPVYLRDNVATKKS